MKSKWFRNAVIYQVDPSLFKDSDGDGWGDFRGITDRLEHVRSLGATCLWLMPFYASPFRDHGYDVSDHLAIDPRFGDIADFVKLLERADELGIRVLIELVVQHTSIEHPWFQSARCSRGSPYRDYYLWSDEPVQTGTLPAFPTVEDGVWTWDEQAGQYYHHVFYAHQADLNIANPRVREEIRRIMAYWLRLGVSGFRVDAASHLVESARHADSHADGMWLLNEMHTFVGDRNPEAILMGESDVEVAHYSAYFGEGRRLNLLLDFWMNNYLFLALARREAAPLERAFERRPVPPHDCRYAVWLRNHDQLDLDRLTASERDEVLASFAPDPGMRIYRDGIRRRLAPMLHGDRCRLEMTHALLFSLPGTPILRYGDEIGMGDDLSLEERHAVRTPMQWSDARNAGFSSAPASELAAPVIVDEVFGYRKLNVEAQVPHPGSLFVRTQAMIRTRLGAREMAGHCRLAKFDCPQVFGLRYDEFDGEGSTMLTFVNLSDEPVSFDVREDDLEAMVDVLTDGGYEAPPARPLRLSLGPYGYRWLRRKERGLEFSEAEALPEFRSDQ